MRKKILVADDDKDLVELLTSRLESKGYEVIGAYEGVRTVELAHKEKPDILILDWKMPVGSGAEVLKDLKSESSTRHIPVIVLTGLDDKDIETEARKYEIAAFMRKPHNDDILLQTIKDILHKKELEESLQ